MRHPITRFATAVALVVCAGIPLGTPFALAQEPACAEAPLLTADTVAYVDGLEAGTTALFAVEVLEPGRLAVEVAVPGSEENLPWIEVRPVPCVSVEAGRGRYLERTLTRQILEVAAPGIYSVRVGAVGPRRGLDGYAVSAQLAPARGIAKTGTSGSDDDTDDSNNEIVPLVSEGPGPVTAVPACED